MYEGQNLSAVQRPPPDSTGSMKPGGNLSAPTEDADPLGLGREPENFAAAAPQR